jgi:hypothetical protein
LSETYFLCHIVPSSLGIRSVADAAQTSNLEGGLPMGRACSWAFRDCFEQTAHFLYETCFERHAISSYIRVSLVGRRSRESRSPKFQLSRDYHHSTEEVQYLIG